MSFMDIFKGFQNGEGKTMAQQTAGGTTGNDPTALTASGAQGNATVPGANTPGSANSTVAAIPATATGEASPLQKYGDLWDKKDTDAKPVDWSTKLSPDKAAVFAASKQADFVAQIDPAILAGASKGDPAALAALVNQATQQAFAHSAIANSDVVNTALERQAQHFKDNVVPQILRQNNIGVAVRDALPGMSDPAVAPVFNMVKDQLSIKHPQATPAQIAQMASEYVTGMSQHVVSSSGKIITDAPKASTNRGDIDWSSYFLGE